MAHVRIAADGAVGAEPALVYALIADYRQHHPRFLPSAFSDFRVEQGGVGASTVMSFQLRLMGRQFSSRQSVTEPEPGRTLVEFDERLRTQFTVDGEGIGSRVTIETEYESPGLQGMVERLVVPRMLGKLYREELVLLDRYAREQAAARRF